MDDPALSEREHRLALLGLRRINALSLTSYTLARYLALLMGRDSGRPRRVLDVACGDGDNTTRLSLLARRRGLPWRIDGCDVSERSVGMARSLAARRGVEATFFQADALGRLRLEGYDAVVSSLFLHHLEDRQIVRFLRRLAGVDHVVIADLVRSRFAYVSTIVGVRCLSRSGVVHTDGPLSVRSALTVSEMRLLVEEAGLSSARVVRCWPMRQLVTWSRRA
ncbi:MAG: methyltransferase domain-containing protein [Phycisphaeraceae bacterium]